MDAQLHFLVKGNSIERLDRFYVVEKSRHYLRARFDGDVNIAVFVRDGIRREVTLDSGGECYVPDDILASAGVMHVSAKGAPASATVEIHETGYKRAHT